MSESDDDQLAGWDGQERRQRLRLDGAFPAKVRGVDSRGQLFRADAIIKNISVEGLCLQLKHYVEPGSRLLIVVQFSTASARWGTGARVAIHGLVLRSEERRAGEEYSVAVAVMHQRFL